MRHIILAVYIIFICSKVNAASIDANGRIQFAQDAIFYNNKPDTLINVLTSAEAKSGHFELIKRLVTDIDVSKNLFRILLFPRLHQNVNVSKMICVLIAKYKKYDLPSLFQIPNARVHLKSLAFIGRDFLMIDPWAETLGNSSFTRLHAIEAMIAAAKLDRTLAAEFISSELKFSTFLYSGDIAKSDVAYSLESLRLRLELSQLLQTDAPEKAREQLRLAAEGLSELRTNLNPYLLKANASKLDELALRLQEMNLPSNNLDQIETRSRSLLSTGSESEQREALIELSRIKVLELETLVALKDYAERGGTHLELAAEILFGIDPELIGAEVLRRFISSCRIAANR